MHTSQDEVDTEIGYQNGEECNDAAGVVLGLLNNLIDTEPKA